jgi:hypothetical protein
MLAHLHRVGRGEQRADREQVTLDWQDDVVDARPRLRGAREAEEPV